LRQGVRVPKKLQATATVIAAIWIAASLSALGGIMFDVGDPVDNEFARLEAELMSLLALMLFQDSRSDARTTDAGDLILLDQQDRSQWNGRAIAHASALLDKALYLHQPPGRYQVEASIAALHVQAGRPTDTDWKQISLLYQRLLELEYTQVLHLNYAVAVAMTGNVSQALNELASIAPQLQNYFPFYCARAEFHARTGDHASSRQDLEQAMTLTQNESEKRFVKDRIKSLSS